MSETEKPNFDEETLELLAQAVAAEEALKAERRRLADAHLADIEKPNLENNEI